MCTLWFAHQSITHVLLMTKNDKKNISPLRENDMQKACYTYI